VIQVVTRYLSTQLSGGVKTVVRAGAPSHIAKSTVDVVRTLIRGDVSLVEDSKGVLPSAQVR
jgi:hypothetical protein